MTYRLSPLPRRFSAQKMNYYVDSKANGFQTYKSPWIPVSESNKELLKEGDLVINCSGLQEPHLVGRKITDMVSNKSWDTMRPCVLKAPPSLVWVDPRKVEIYNRHLRNNPLAEVYQRYSEAIRISLVWAASLGRELTESVSFPLFHATNRKAADELVTNGVDIYHVYGRCTPSYGYAFFLAVSEESAINAASFPDTVIQYMANPHSPPRQINRSIQSIYGITGPVEAVISSESRYGRNLYSWSTVCTEMNATALRRGHVMIFDGFDQLCASRAR